MIPNSTKCQNCNKEFLIENDDVAFYERIQVPPPTFCPTCRLERRLLFCNERTLYRGTCALCGKNMLTIHGPHTKFKKIYCPPCWWSDKWSADEYFKECDFAKPFFEQYKELYYNVPVLGLNVLHQTLVNSDYTNQVGHVKNCYLLFNSDYDENCSYGTEIESSKDCFDNLKLENCNFCYECVNCEKCYQTYFSVDCESSHNIWFSKNLSGCSDCFGCANLKKKQYCVWNQQYSKQEYETELKNLNPHSSKNQKKLYTQAKKFWQTFPQKYMHGRQNTNVSGDYINHSNNVHNSFFVTESQNCKYCMWMLVKPIKDCWDYTEYGDNAEQMYESRSCGNGVSNVKFSQWILNNSRNVEYSSMCFAVQNIFGCVGLRKGEYRILNKQYTKEEYESLIPKIKQHMNELPYTDNKNRTYRYGEYFPANLCTFGYNETTAQTYLPLTKEKMLEKGYSWKDPEEKKYQITIKSEDAPDYVNDVPDTIANEIIECASTSASNIENSEFAMWHSDQCTGAFRITLQEFEFYKSQNLPLPQHCPNCRHARRFKERNAIKLQKRKCGCVISNEYKNTIEHFHGSNPCPNEFETAYVPEKKDIVYCEQCYQAEIA